MLGKEPVNNRPLGGDHGVGLQRICLAPRGEDGRKGGNIYLGDESCEQCVEGRILVHVSRMFTACALLSSLPLYHTYSHLFQRISDPWREQPPIMLPLAAKILDDQTPRFRDVARAF